MISKEQQEINHLNRMIVSNPEMRVWYMEDIKEIENREAS